MYFLPTDDQRELSRGVADLLAARFPLERLPEGFDPALWQELTDTGVFTLRTELGLGLAEAALVFEQLGRACVPGPLVSTFLAAGLSEGPVTWVDVRSTPLLVPHLDRSAALLVLDTDVRLTSSPPTGHPITELVDPLSPLHEIAGIPDAPVVGDAAVATRMRLEGAMLTAALQVGLAAR